MTQTNHQKDIWDRITALATILVPAAIALAGHFIAQGLKQAEINSEERRAELSYSIAETNTKISQANLINTMMQSLTSTNPQERKLAVQAVLIALPEHGPVLARTIAASDEDASVQTAAKESLVNRRNELIRNLFADNAQLRIAAARDFIQGWQNDSHAISELLNFASQNMENPNGVYNTIVVLNQFSKRALEIYRVDIDKFLDKAKQIGPKTSEQAMLLEERLKDTP